MSRSVAKVFQFCLYVAILVSQPALARCSHIHCIRHSRISRFSHRRDEHLFRAADVFLLCACSPIRGDGGIPMDRTRGIRDDASQEIDGSAENVPIAFTRDFLSSQLTSPTRARKKQSPIFLFCGFRTASSMSAASREERKCYLRQWQSTVELNPIRILLI